MNYNARSIIVAFSFTAAKVQQKMRLCNSRMHFLTQSQENGAFFYAKSSFCTNFFHGVTKLVCHICPWKVYTFSLRRMKI